MLISIARNSFLYGQVLQNLKPRYLADRITLVAILMGERMKIRRMDVKMK